MSFPRFPEYKDSGVPWLGEVPAHWFVGKVKHITSFFTGWTPPTGNAAFYEGENPWANISDLGPKWLAEPSKRISDEAVGHSGITLSPTGSLLFSFKLSIGQVSFAARDMYTNEAIATFPPSERLNLAFAYYALPHYVVQNASENIYGAKLLNQELIKTASVAVPSIHEQQAIATFLDCETAKIDALVAEQEKLIALLQEKRQAVISHAVTKGLDPNVPMKDSGVKWLGEVPGHWEVCALKRHWTATDCKHVTAEFVEDGIPLASIREVQSRWVALEEAKRTTEYFYRLLIEGGRDPRPGDLIFSRNATVGEVAQVHRDHELFAMGQDVVLLRRAAEAASPDFLQLVIRSSVVTQQLALCMVGSTFKRINVEEIRSLVIAFPPPDEQTTIANHLLSEAAGFDSLITEARTAITLLQERRTALISAAVTGQIDVRGIASRDVS